MDKKIISYVTDGIMSGILLCVGCAVSMSSDTKVLGAFLFSLGLFAIIKFKLGLYTGKAGYMAVKPPKYIIEVVITLLSNAAGTCIGALLLRTTRFSEIFDAKATGIIEMKFSDDPISIFLLAVFCGVMMFVAVDGNKRSSESGDHIGALFAIVAPVMVFVICGFNHCIADMAYFFISGCSNLSQAPLYFLLAMTGNAVGCMLIPIAKKLSINPL